MSQPIEVDVHTIICEKAILIDERLDVHGVFNLTKANNNNNNVPFSVVTTTVVNNGENELKSELYVYIVLEAHIERLEQPRYKLMKELHIEINGKSIDRSLNIFSFKTRKLISEPGMYYFKAYQLEGKSDLRSVLEKGKKISSTVLEVE